MARLTAGSGSVQYEVQHRNGNGMWQAATLEPTVAAARRFVKKMTEASAPHPFKARIVRIETRRTLLDVDLRPR